MTKETKEKKPTCAELFKINDILRVRINAIYEDLRRERGENYSLTGEVKKLNKELADVRQSEASAKHNAELLRGDVRHLYATLSLYIDAEKLERFKTEFGGYPVQTLGYPSFTL